ncbi:MAG: hypothetical protein HYT72_03895 [Candidatus Aenigmarchaeota archaeon]|nr:hypothetical protein [Candidatus Aenigmarchaeota archaeon]
MQLDKLYFERELIPVSFDAGDLDIFTEKKLAESHYKKAGYAVIQGLDFENNMVSALKNEFSYLDPYLKVKLGHAKGSSSITAYGDKVLQYISRQEVMLMLYLCRLCSYLGGPGFPDFIVIDQQTRKWFLVVVAEELPPEYVLFMFMAKLLGKCEIKISNIQRAGIQKQMAIDIKDVFENISKTERFKGFSGGIEDEVYRLRNLKDPDAKDELSFLEEQTYKMPFFLIKKWLKEGRAEKDDVLLTYENFEKSNRKMKDIIERLSGEMRNDNDYKAIGNSKDEETLKKKFDWLMETFGMGESRAKELLGLLV